MTMSVSSSRRGIQPATVLLWIILALATFLRFFRIGSQSLWADEGNSVVMAHRSLAEITVAAAADIHPPLYYWLLSLWVRIFGDSEIALRALSAVWGILTVWLVYQVGSRLVDRRTGLVAALFAAINPFLIYYSQEVRMYAQVTALAALLFYGLVRFILHESVILPPDGTGTRMAFSGLATAIVVGASIAGLYTHYTFLVLILAVTALYLLWVYDSRRRGFVRVRLLHWAMLMIVIALFYLPWASTAVQQLLTWPRSGENVPLGQALSQIGRLLALGPVAQVELGSPWLVVFLGLFILGLWPWVRPNGRRAHWLTWLMPLVWLTAPVVLILANGLYKEAYLKFLLVAVPPFCLIMARGVTGFMEALERGSWAARRTPSPPSGHPTARPGRPGNEQPLHSLGSWLAHLWLVAALVLVAVPSAQTLAAYYFDPAVARDDYRGMAAYVAAAAKPGDAIILDAPGQEEVFDYYYDGPLTVYGLPEQRPPDPAATIDRVKAIASQHPHLYGLFWATGESDPDRLVEGWLDTHAYKAADTWRGNVRFVIYATPQSTVDWPVQPSNVTLGEQITLQQYALSSEEVTSGDLLQLQLQWLAQVAPTVDYTVFVQLLDGRNQVVAQRDAAPVSSERPTNIWQAGETILDNHGLLVPPGTAPGDYRLIAGMYDAQTGQRLKAGDMDSIELGTIRVSRPAQPPLPAALGMQSADSFTFDEITLLGHDRYKRGFRHDPTEPLRATDPLHLTLYWRTDTQPTTAWWFTARLVRGNDQEVAAVSGPLVSELYPTLNWQQGEVVRGEHDLLIPDYVTPGRYQLQLFLHTGNPAAGIDRVNLGTVVIAE